MPAGASPWRIDDALAKEVADAAGCSLDAPLDELGPALLRWIPSGSTAKREAMDRDELPPGLDPAAVAEAILAGSRHSWTCWPASTIAAAVLAARGHDAEVVAELRLDPHAPPVDVHSAVVVDGEALVDPCLGPGWPMRLDGDTATAPWVAAEIVPFPDGRWGHLSRMPGQPVNRYRVLARQLDRDGVRAFLEVSRTHSGVPAHRRSFRRTLVDGSAFVSERDGRSRFRRWQQVAGGEGWAVVDERWGAFADLVLLADEQ